VSWGGVGCQGEGVRCQAERARRQGLVIGCHGEGVRYQREGDGCSGEGLDVKLSEVGVKGR
jgi:hypothetical protein